MTTAIVIGAGLAGLAAARRLAEAGIPAAVLEQGPHVGGRAHTDVVDGFHINTGAQFLAHSFTHTRRLIRALGLAADEIPVPVTAGILRGGRVHRLFPDLRLLLSPLYTVRSRLLFARVARDYLRYWPHLDPHRPARAHRLDTRSIADYAHRRLNPELLEYGIAPALAGIFYWTPEATSQAVFFILLKSLLGRALPQIRLYSLRGGLGGLAAALARDRDVRLNTQVTRVTRAPTGGYTVAVEVAGQPQTLTAAAVVCATTAVCVPGLFPDLSAAQRAFFQAVRYAPTASTAIAIRRSLASDLYSIYFPRREPTVPTLAAAVFHSGKMRGVAAHAQVPPGRDLVQLYASGTAAPDLLDRPDDAVHARLRAELHAACPAYTLTPDELWHRVYRWPHAVPQFEVGALRRLRDFHAGGIETDTLVFAGDYLGGPFVEGAITSGLTAATRLLAGLRA